MKKSLYKNNNCKQGKLADFLGKSHTIIYGMTHGHKNVIQLTSERSKSKLGLVAEQETQLMELDHQLADLENLLEYIVRD